MHVWLYSTLLFILRQILQSVMRKESRKICLSCKYRWIPRERLIISFQRLYGSKTVDFLLLSPCQSKCLVAFLPCLPPIFSRTVKMRNKTAITVKPTLLKTLEETSCLKETFGVVNSKGQNCPFSCYLREGWRQGWRIQKSTRLMQLECKGHFYTATMLHSLFPGGLPFC